MSSHIAAVVRSVRIGLSQAEAFELFTTGLDVWWPFKDHSCTDDSAAMVRFDGRVGGQVTEMMPGGSASHVWGTITSWDPPDHFAMTWHPGQSPDQSTRLSVRFRQESGGCVVELTHDGWESRGDQAKTARESYDSGWPTVLAEFAAAATRKTAHPT